MCFTLCIMYVSVKEPIDWKVMHPNSTQISMKVERRSVPNMLFGLSVEVSPSRSSSRNWTSSGIKWNTCIYKKNGSRSLLLHKQIMKCD